MTIHQMRLAAAAAVAIFAAHADAQNRVNWIGASGVELAWDQGDNGAGEGDNWESAGVPPENFQPDRTFGVGEYGSISNGGIALIDHGVGVSPADIRLGEDSGTTGSLAIRTGGAISVQAGSQGSGTLLNGVGGAGELILQNDIGAVSLQNYSQNGASMLTAQFGSAGFTNPVAVSSTISLGGALRLEPTQGSGFVAGPGDSWTIMQGAPVTGAFDSIEFAPLLLSNPGQTLTVDTQSNAVVVSVEQRLVVQVNRFTGETSLYNASGHATSIDLINYTLRSGSPLLSDDANWLSFEDDAGKPGWTEANPTASALSELNAQGALTLTPGDSHDFGTPVAVNTAAPIGTPRLDADSTSLSYQLPNGELVEAGLEVVGRHNDLVLVIDPATGIGTMQNQSTQSVELISYTVSSDSDSLLPGFSGSGLAGWSIANPSTSNLSELNTGDALLVGVGFEAALGTLWDTSQGIDDNLTFSYQLATGALLEGTVSFGDLAVIEPALAGDYNNDGAVDAADYTVWRDALGTSAALPNDPIGGVIGNAQYAQWRNNYGATPANSATSTAAPEPAALLLLLASATCLVAQRKR